jgi:hypothetical protein
MPLVSLSTPLQSERTFDAYSSASAIWSGAKDRFVSIIPTGLGLAGMVFTVSFLFGAVVNWFLQRKTTFSGDGKDYCTQTLCRDIYQYRSGYAPLQGNELTQLSPQEDELRIHLRESELIQLSPAEAKLKILRDRISTVFHAVLKGALLVAGLAWYTDDPLCPQLSLAFLAMGAGINLGYYAREYYLRRSTKDYYDKDNDQQIKELVKGFTDDVCSSSNLNLSPFSDHLRYFNPIKLKEETYKKLGKKYDSLTLRGSRLADDDLGRLAKAGWLSNLSSINISDNPQLTGIGLKYLGEMVGKNLTFLNLSNTDLTDDDLKQMIGSGCFNSLEKFIICHNPRITGEGLAYLIQGGLENLEWLNVGGNPLILGENLDKWSGKKGFERLKALSLDCSGLTRDEFERIIEENDWIKNLKGLDVSGNPELTCPSNIAKLTNLSKYDIPYGLPTVWFEGCGLFVKKCPKFGPTKEHKLTEGFKALLQSQQAFLV